MLDQIRDLYQEVVFDHNRNPRNFRVMEDANRTIEGFNPLCGDRLSLTLRIEAEKIADIRFEGKGCAISTASASLMCEAVKGRSIDDVEALRTNVHRMLTGAEDPPAGLGKLAALAGVREYPARVKCASLAWHTLQAALQHRAAAEAGAATVSTE